MAVAFIRSETPGTEEATLFYGNERDADTLSIKDDGLRPTEERNRALFAWETRSLVRRRILQAVIGVLGIVIIVFIILAFKLSTSDREYSYLGTARIKLNEKIIDFKNAAGEFVLSANFGKKLGSILAERHTKSKSRARYVNSDGITWTLTQETEFMLSVNWSSLSKDPTVFLDCFKLSKAHWYGGSELIFQEWPLENVQVGEREYLPQDINRSQNKSMQTFGPVLERYWLSSRGIAIIVDTSVPLHVSINANGSPGQLCLKSDTTGYLQPAVSYLGYRVLSGYNLRDLHLMVVKEFLGKPSGIPNKALIRKPSWVLGNDSDNFSQNSVESLSGKISNSNCAYVVINSQYFEKDRKLKPKTGWLKRNELPFQVDDIDCNVSMNIHPLIKVSSTSFSKVANKGYLVKDCGGKVPGIINWSNSLAACIDLTYESSKTWFKEILAGLGYDSFEFHGGDVTHLPACYQFHNKTMDPGYFSSEYAKFAAKMNCLNVHVGHRTQTLPVFVRMTTKDSTWNALKTLIPTVLTYGIMGYPYVLPSVIGGDNVNVSKELYIRWMQVTTFLPGMQFNVDNAPWKRDKETNTIFENMMKLRENLYPVMLDAFKNATITGAPIIRPLWWVAPTDPVALTIDSQFMLGDIYLVAPVLDREKFRSVYLPVGRWQEQFGKHNVTDNKKAGLVKKYSVKDLEIIPYFKCLALY